MSIIINMYGVLCLYLVLGLFSIYSTIMSDLQLNSISKCKCVIVRNNSPSNCFGCLTMDVIYSFMFRFARRTLWSLQMGHYKKKVHKLTLLHINGISLGFLLICAKKTVNILLRLLEFIWTSLFICISLSIEFI